jgi:hypothetical protein
MWFKLCSLTPAFFASLIAFAQISVKPVTVAPASQVVIPVENPIWPRPVIVPIPALVFGVRQPVISLNGTWKITTDPQGDFWQNETDVSLWKDIPAPAQIDMQGVRVQAGKQYAYKKKIIIPADYKNKRVFIRFEGVSGTAKAWINGQFLREHFGGFNVWTCDITDYVTPGTDAWLTVAITETPPEKVTAGMDRGGILRNVKLMAVAQDYLNRFNIETDLDEQYKNAVMKVWVGLNFNKQHSTTVRFTLKDPQGKIVNLPVSSYQFSKDKHEAIINIPVSNPVKWDAEHPELYTLDVAVMDGNTVAQTVSKKVGFREIKVDGVKMLINGKEVKFRGGARYDSDPIYGRYLSDEESWKEVKMFKDANLNYVRVHCYPASEAYIDACDKLGMYLQYENAVTFTRGAQHDTASTRNFLSQMAEMIEVGRSHPSVTIYELANETYYGINIGKTYEYTKAEDPSRPVSYSWSQSVPAGLPWPYEIFSMHYPDWDGELGKPSVSVFNSREVRPLPQGMPVLHDEFAHGSTYYQASLSRDPGMRDFWGISIKKFWERMFVTEGCLGGAMFAMIDDNAGGTWAFEWGAIDLWRRERPEYWHLRKAYSPVRINDEEPLVNPGSNSSLNIPVKNWYDHTNFNELTIQWSVKEQTGKLKGPAIQPHGAGTITIPPRSWKKDDVLNLNFFDSYNRLIDEFNLLLSSPVSTVSEPAGPIPTLREDSTMILVSGKNFEILFDKTTGMIKSGKYKGNEVIKGGPYFHLTGGTVGQWKLKTITASPADDTQVFVTIDGAYDSVGVVYNIGIDGTGLITTEYTLNNFKVSPPMPRKIPWNNQDAGGFEEVGISYLLTGDVDKLSWKRKGLWSVYPDDHIGRSKGTANRYGTNNEKVFGKKPSGKWYQDEKDFSVFGQYDIGGRGTNDFRSTKENIYEASAIASDKGKGIKVESNGIHAVRMQVVQDNSGWIDNNSSAIKYSGAWLQATDTMNYFKSKEMRSTNPGDFVEYSFNGTGIAWLGSKGRIFGTADVYIDDKLEASNINFFNRGGNAIPQAVIYSKEGLTKGNHTIKIVAKEAPAFQGRPGEQNSNTTRTTGIPLDGFVILDGNIRGDVMLIINNKWNQTKMGLGNYMKDPILIGSQYRDKVTVRLTDVNKNLR